MEHVLCAKLQRLFYPTYFMPLLFKLANVFPGYEYIQTHSPLDLTRLDHD